MSTDRRPRLVSATAPPLPITSLTPCALKSLPAENDPRCQGLGSRLGHAGPWRDASSDKRPNRADRTGIRLHVYLGKPESQSGPSAWRMNPHPSPLHHAAASPPRPLGYGCPRKDAYTAKEGVREGRTDSERGREGGTRREGGREGGREGDDQSVSQSDGRTDSDRQTGQMEMESRHRKGERGGCGVWGMIEGGREEGR